MANYCELLQNTNAADTILLITGLICSALVGMVQTGNMLVIRSVLNEFITSSAPKFSTGTLIGFLLLGSCVILAGAGEIVCMKTFARRKAGKLRQLYFKSVMRQDIEWFDQQSTGALISKGSVNINNIEQGIGLKLGTFVQYTTGSIVNLICAFSIAWKLTIAACPVIPLLAILFGVSAYIFKYLSKKELVTYSRIGTVCSEALANIRTVIAFGGEETELRRYVKKLDSVKTFGIIKSTVYRTVLGGNYLVQYTSAAFILWYGTQLLVKAVYDPGTIITVFVLIIVSGNYLGFILPTIPYFISAHTSWEEISGIMQSVPKINKDNEGYVIPDFQANISFQNVKFSYPTRPELTILDNFNVNIKSGQTVAIIGPSGSGKSSVMQLIQRFYDPTEGRILIDGVDLHNLSLKPYRKLLGYVQQEPVLFECTIAENIKMGKLDATEEEIMEAAKLSNAHSFIKELPDGYNTVLNEHGAGISGGEKQRIAIARALVRKPKLLLLDEATSALDTYSEKLVQEALDKASSGRTVIIVAHRLSTIRNVDVIVVLENGVICEVGNHETLVAKNGLYAKLLEKQNVNREERMNVMNTDDEVDEQWNIKESDEVNKPDWTKSALTMKNDDGNSRLQETLNNKRTVAIICELFKMNMTESVYIILGCIMSIVDGCVQPAFALLYSEVYRIFQMIINNKINEAQHLIKLVVTMMAVVGLVKVLLSIVEGYVFGKSGEALTKRMRYLSFAAMLKQEVNWFDQPQNSTGALMAKLTSEASGISNITGKQLGFIFELLSMILMTYIAGCIVSWQLTLLITVFCPLIALTAVFEMGWMSDYSAVEENVVHAKIMQQAMSSNRTITTFGLESYYLQKLQVQDLCDQKKHFTRYIFNGILYGLANSAYSFCNATAFPMGRYLLEQKITHSTNIFRSYIVVTMSAQAIGGSISQLGDYSRAITTAKYLLTIIKRESQIPTHVGKIPTKPFCGNVTLNDVSFTYSTRPSCKVLKSISYKIENGQSVALVGHSGCGKSTIMHLLQRFYNPTNSGPGTGIFFDDMNILELAPSWVRRQIGIVSQEPHLFNLTIRENIEYGEHARQVTMNEIIIAARMANIHDFIMSLPEAYETICGEGGSQLSGGQKQRVAIARAMLRSPKLLLLDEATSALDTESEHIVQAALDAAICSRTSIVIAHRMCTVMNSHAVVVIEDGHIIESGPPYTLISRKASFYELCKHQTIDG